MKNKKRYLIPLAVLSSAFAIAAVGCGTDYESPEYSYTNPNRDVTPHEKDPEFTLDGKLDEGFWQQSRWLQSYKASNPLVNYKATSWIGEKGLYMAFDVNDPNVYVNPDRSVYINSGIELYLSDNSAEAMTTGSNHAYEVELSADGKTSNVTKWGPSGYKGAWQEQFDFAVTPKGGAVNTSECTGYVMEAFFPNRMFGATEKMDAVRANIAILSTIDYTSNARDWWNSGEQDIGCIWGTPASWYEFGADGLHGAYDVTFTASENVSISGKISALRGKSYTATFTPAAGYAVSKVTCNGVDVTNKLTYTETAAQYTTIANEDLTFAAEAVEITAGNKTLSGTVKLHQNGKLTVDRSVTATLTQAATGTVHALTVGADGSFSIGDLPQGLYTLNLRKEGFGEQSYTVMLNRDVTVDYLLEAKSLFVKQENGWDISTQNDGYITLLQGGYTGLEFAEKYGDFLFETKFQEINHVAGKDCPRNQLRVQFSDDNYITFDLMHNQRDGLLHLISFGGDNGGNYMYPWQVHYTFSAAETAAYRNGGLSFKLLRSGSTFYVFVNERLVKTFDALDTELARLYEAKEAEITAEDLEDILTGNVKLFLYHWEDKGYEQKMPLYMYTDEEELAAPFTGKVVLPETVENGSISVSAEQFDIREGGQITFTFTPDEGYLLASVKINGINRIAEVVNGTLAVDADASVLNVEVLFADINAKVNTTITFTDGEAVDGVKVRLVLDGNVVKEDVISGGKVTFEEVQLASYKVEVNLYNYWANAGTVFASGDEETEIKLASLFREELFTVDGHVSHDVTREYFHELSSDIAGDAWFATKIKVDADALTGDVGQNNIRIGVSMYFGSLDNTANHAPTLVYSSAHGWGIQQVNTWVHDGYNGLSDTLEAALTGDGLYMAIFREAATGKLYLYFGTSPENMQLETISAGWTTGLEEQKGNITKFGLGFWHASGYDYQAEFDFLSYGKTLSEAFDVGADITVNNPSVEHGAVTVTGDKTGGAVTISVAPENGYNLKSLLINGVERAADVNEDGMLVLSEHYCLATLDVAAEFERAEAIALEGNVTLKKINGTVPADGAKIVFTGAIETYEVTVTNGKINLPDIFTGRYRVTVTGAGFENYIPLTVEVGSATTIDLTFEYRVFSSSVNGSGTVADATNDSGWNLSAMNEGKITIVGGGYHGINFAGTYNDVVAKIKVKNYSTSGEVRNELRFTLSGGKVLALEVYRNGGDVWQIQLPPWDNCDATVSNWSSRYNLSAEEIELLNGDGLWFEVARVGADYYVFLNGTQTNVFTLEGTADEVATVSVYHWGDGGTDIEYEYGIDGAAEDAFEGRVILPETLEHGAISADKQTFDIRNNEQITFTITADENYLLGDVRINGVSVITEVVNGTLTVNANAKELNVEVVFVDATIPVDTTIVFTDGDEVEGVAVRIVSNGQVVAEDVISGGKVTFEQVSRGTYRVEAKLLNYWANAGTVLAAGGEDAEIKLASLFRDELLTVDGNVSHNVNREYFHELNSNITGDAWFATKFRVDGSTIVGDDGQIRFGIDLNFGTAGDANRTLTFVYNSSPDRLWGIQQVNGSWPHDSFAGMTSEMKAAITGDGLYMAIHREVSTGKLYLYLGTSIENMRLVGGSCAWTVGADFQKETITKFGLGFWYTSGHEYTVGFDFLRYGDTLAEALNIEENITINKNIGENGTVNISGEKKGDAIMLQVTPDQGYNLKSLTVNGVDRTEDVSASGTLSVSDFYMLEELTIAAEFEQANTIQLYAGVVLVRNGNRTAAPSGTEVVFTGTGTYQTTVDGNGNIAISDMPAGRYEVRLGEIGYRPVSLEITEETNELVFNWDIEDIAFSSNAVSINHNDKALAKNYVLTGKIDIDSRSGNNYVVLQFNGNGNNRFVALWDFNGSWGQYAVGATINGTHKFPTANQDPHMEIPANACFAYPASGESLTVSFKLVVTEKHAFLYLNDILTAVLANMNLTDQAVQTQVSNANGKYYDLTAVSLEDEPALYAAEIEKMAGAIIEANAAGNSFYWVAGDVTVNKTVGEGGSVNVSASKCREDVTITVTPDAGYALAELTVNGETVDVVNGTYTISGYNALTLDVAATFVEVHPITITNPEVEGGSVTVVSGEEVGDEVRLSLAADEGYVLKSLTINGTDRTSDVDTDGNILVSGNYGEDSLVISAAFELAANLSMNADVVLHKGDTVASGEGGTVVLKGLTLGLQNYSFEITDGAITLNNILAGKYEATVVGNGFGGYLPTEITVTEDTTEIAFNWEIPSVVGIVGGNEVKQTITHRGETLTRNFVLSGYLDINEIQGNGNYWIQFRFNDNDQQRFLIWNFNYGYTFRVAGWVGNFNLDAPESAWYTMEDGNPITLKFKFVVTDKHAFLYINDTLTIAISNIPASNTGVMLGSIRTGCEFRDIEAISLLHDKEAYEAEVANLATEIAAADAKGNTLYWLVS